MRTAVILTTAALATLTMGGAQAAVTKVNVIACKQEADLRAVAKLRNQADKTGSEKLESEKLSKGDCVQIPRNSIVKVDQHKTPLICVRPSGGFDCYWTVSSAIDEFATDMTQQRVGSGTGGADSGPSPRRKR